MRRWTKEEIAKLRSEVKAGKSPAEIQIPWRPLAAIQSAIYRFGLKLKSAGSQWRPSEIESLLSQWQRAEDSKPFCKCHCW